jgi:uncharacterized protein (DUF1810 family)
MTPSFDLDRFVTAQAPVIDTVRAELDAGRKRTHWMWFIFPQLRGLGQSDRAIFYGLDGPAEAAAYFGHAVLGPRLRDCVSRANAAPVTDPVALFGEIDAQKYRSCLTLFEAVAPEMALFADGLARFYGGDRCQRTLAKLAAAGGSSARTGRA